MSSFDFHFPSAKLVVTGALLALAGGILAVGCGNGGFDYPTEQDFCQAAAEVDCSQLIVQACFGTYSDQTVAECVASRQSAEVCNPQQLTYHPEAADGCIAAHQALYSSNVLDPSLYQQMVQACLPVFNKSGEVDAPCTQDADCDVGNGLFCIVHQGASGTGARGSCQIPNPVSPGASCQTPADQCVDQNGATDTYYCAYIDQSHGQNCIMNPTVGNICGSDVPCSTGLYCDATSGKCAPQHQGLSPCSADGECSGGFCIPTSGTSGVCAAMITLGTGSPACFTFGSIK